MPFLGRALPSQVRATRYPVTRDFVEEDGHGAGDHSGVRAIAR